MYNKLYNNRITPQSEPIPGEKQIKNAAGGYVYEIDHWEMLDRFLILGTDQNTYYADKKTLTVDAMRNLLPCIDDDYKRMVQRIVDVSQYGLAPKNDPALFLLAMLSGHNNHRVRKLALGSLSYVARTGTHLFLFVEYINAFRGWGRGLRTAVANWYLHKNPMQLAYQVAKYKNRYGWTHRDVLRVCHPKTDSEKHNKVFKWVLGHDFDKSDLPSLLNAVDYAHLTNDIESVLPLIYKHSLTREMLPSNMHSNKRILTELLINSPTMALIRNLNNYEKNELLTAFSNNENIVCNKLNKVNIRSSLIHPMQIFTAIRTVRLSSNKILKALEDAFYHAFKNVEPTGKNIFLAVDVSGSMTWEYYNGIQALDLAAAFSSVLINTEDNVFITAFSGNLIHMSLSKGCRLNEVVSLFRSVSMGRTDCAKPMLYAIENNMENVDAFIILTDNETWAGGMHPMQAFNNYKNKFNNKAKLITVAMTGTNGTISDPSDTSTLGISGFDSSGPQIISNFIRG